MQQKTTIRIKKCSAGFYFGGVLPKEYYVNYHPRICGLCKTKIVNDTYAYLIEKLKKAGLIDKDYPLFCCNCWNRKKLGIKNDY